MSKLTRLDEQVIRKLISMDASVARREALLRQFNALADVRRTEDPFGYYLDFDVGPGIEAAPAPDTPLEFSTFHPDKKNQLIFVLYTKDGLLHFLEASSSDHWPYGEALSM